MGLRLHGRLTVVRAATADDADRLVGWHADPEVSRFWDDETYTREEILDRLARGEVESFVVEAAGEPVGYLQAWNDLPGDGGIDMFLVPGARGRGLGPDAARTLSCFLRDERGWPRVTVDPYLWNEAAIRAWRRAGFRDVDEHEPDEGHRSRWLLMEFVD